MNQKIKPLNGKYIIKAFLDHKEKYLLDGGEEIIINKSYDNNLRERNPQLGRVEAVPEQNVLGLKEGDLIVAHHLAFYGDITVNRGFDDKNVVLWEDETIVFVSPDRIFGKYEDGKMLSLGNYVFCEEIEKEENSLGLIIPDQYKKDTNRVKVVSGNGEVEPGDILLLPDNSIYPITVDKKEYIRIFVGDIFGYVRNGEIHPFRDYFIAKDIEMPKKSEALNLTLMKVTHKISVVTQLGAKCRTVKVGDRLYRGAGTGLKYKDIVLLNDDHYSVKLDENNKIRVNQ